MVEDDARTRGVCCKGFFVILMLRADCGNGLNASILTKFTVIKQGFIQRISHIELKYCMCYITHVDRHKSAILKRSTQGAGVDAC